MRIGEYAVHFHRFKDTLPLSGKEVQALMCTLHTGECRSNGRFCEIPNAIRVSTQCSPKDKNRPVVGRKIALARALKAANLTKEQREAFWMAFHEKAGIPKSNHRKAA